MTGSPTWDRPWLVADVGGTNIRFGLVTVRHGRPHTVRVMPLRDHLDLADAVETYLANFGHHGRPAAACVAVAGPVQGDRFRMTNGSWDISVEESRRRLGFEQLELLNDLAALALAVPHLAEADVRRIGDAATTARLGTASEPISQPEPVAVVGCGTGLGVAGLRWSDDRWAPIAGEGGHVDPPIVDDLEAEVMRILRAEQGHVTAECVLSGPGLSRLHRSLAAALDQPVTARSAAEICAARTDPLCHQTLRMFCALLGSFSGNVALTLGARGGVWLGGGVLPRIADALQDSDFRARFEAKFRMADYVRDISTRLITAPTPALISAGAWLDQSIHATSALFTPAVSDDRRSSAKPS